jgi:hypothetical protein
MLNVQIGALTPEPMGSALKIRHPVRHRSRVPEPKLVRVRRWRLGGIGKA